jgi:hypothetical protein
MTYISDRGTASLEDILGHMSLEMGEPAPEDALHRVLGQLVAHGLVSAVDDDAA